MHETKLILLIFLYIITGVFYVTKEVLYLKKKNRIDLVTYFRAMYIIIYCLVPILMIFDMFSFNSNNRYTLRLDTSTQGILNLYIFYFASVTGYVSFNFGGLIKKKQKMYSDSKIISKNSILYSSLMIFALGFISLYLWTKVYGSPFEMLEHSRLIRSGYITVRNPYAFMKHLANLLVFSTYSSFLLIIYPKIGKENKFKKLISIVLFIFSMFWSIIFLVANDGRMGLILIFSITILTYMEIKNRSYNRKITKQIGKYIILALASFVLMSFGDFFLGIVNNSKNVVVESNSITSIIREELGFTFLSGQVAIESYASGLTGFRFPTDVFGAVIAWVPTSIIKNRPETLFAFNTHLVGDLSGTIPTDFISLTIHELGVFGPVLIPMVLGYIIKNMDQKIYTKEYDPYYMMLKVIIGFYIIKSVSHSDFSNIMMNIFFILVGHSIVLLFNYLKIGGGNNDRLP